MPTAADGEQRTHFTHSRNTTLMPSKEKLDGRIGLPVRQILFLVASLALASLCVLAITGLRRTHARTTPGLSPKTHTLSLTLHAGITSDGKDSFYFNGQPNAPTLRLSPGDQLKIRYINDLPSKPQEKCLITPCMDMTNLHFHGMTVSPEAPQDDVLDMMAVPGKSLSYTVQIPKDHPPGLYWYHTHPHGESYRQVLDGMSGAIVIEGIESYFPALAGLPERVLVVRGRSVADDPQSTALKQRVELSSYVCGAEPETPHEIMTVNGSVRPQIEIAPGERQFWRLVNASADRYVDLELEGQKFEIVAMDGEPIAHHDPDHRTRIADHVSLPPAGRVGALVSGSGARTPPLLVSP